MGSLYSVETIFFARCRDELLLAEQLGKVLGKRIDGVHNMAATSSSTALAFCTVIEPPRPGSCCCCCCSCKSSNSTWGRSWRACIHSRRDTRHPSHRGWRSLVHSSSCSIQCSLCNITATSQHQSHILVQGEWRSLIAPNLKWWLVVVEGTYHMECTVRFLSEEHRTSSAMGMPVSIVCVKPQHACGWWLRGSLWWRCAVGRTNELLRRSSWGNGGLVCKNSGSGEFNWLFWRYLFHPCRANRVSDTS